MVSLWVIIKKKNWQKRFVINQLLLCGYQITNWVGMMNWCLQIHNFKKKFQKAIASDKAIDVKISKTQIHHVARKGGSLFGTLVSLAQKCSPWQQILPRRYIRGLQLVYWVTFVILEKTRFLDKACIRKRAREVVSLIPWNELDQFITHRNLLTEKQKEQIIAPLQSHEEATLFGPALVFLCFLMHRLKKACRIDQCHDHLFPLVDK